MKDRKKPKGTKARVQAHKKRLTYIGYAITVAILVGIIAVSSFFLYSMLHSPSEQTSINPTLQFKPDNPKSKLKAVIVDHLSLTFPNQTFIRTATTILKQAGYTVDYYSGEQVTVEFYRNLPTHGYELIILRVHSALQFGKEPPVVLFTSERFDPYKCLHEVLTDRLPQVAYSQSDPKQGRPTYFGITPKFVRQDMKGEFQNTKIIMMGCNGLTYTQMAKALIQKGAKVYIGWSALVSANYTDKTIVNLLEHLILERQTVKQAVENTMKEDGTDPAYKSLLAYYPLEAGEQTIENISES